MFGPPENQIPPTNLVIVVHLPPNTDDKALGILFSRVGPVEAVSIARNERSGKCLGYGFVKYFHSKDAFDAVNLMNLYPVNQRNILKVSPYYHGITKINMFDRTNLLIQNIPPGTLETDIFRHFVKYGGLASCSLIPPGEHAYVRYDNVADAMTAVAENDGLQFSKDHNRLIVRFNTFIQIIN